MNRPLITLLTDFGTADSYVAEMKAVLLGAVPQATLVDLTHAVPPGDLRAAAYLLGRTWHRFPAGTVHLAVVDPGVGTARAALAFATGGHWFVGPDNGLFTPVLRDAAVEIVTLPIPTAAAPTFHGRDLFAPAAAALAGGTPLEILGEPFRGIPHRLSYREPHYEGKSVVGEVVYVDRFGTLVTSLTIETVPEYAVIEVEGLEIGPLRRTFGDVPTGGLLAYLGSGGQVEIAVRDGSAARRLGLGVGGRIRARLG
ncbi:MAG TPA: SAM-dependent chlorinase/fluorinase [Gemmatimonadales bacterium]|nr:SAM-dependent chlorinase/fluorinase [Gemmatimonadales bacterium]